MYYEDVKSHVEFVFGTDARFVEIEELANGGYRVSCGMDAYDVRDWSDLDVVDELFEAWAIEKCSAEDFSDVPALED